MAAEVKVVAQAAMDLFYTNYAADSDFFTINDFIFHVCKEAADYLRQEFKNKYEEIRQEKEDAVVDFSDDWLETDLLNVEEKDGVIFAKLKNEVFSIPYDSQNSGIQDVFPTTTTFCPQLERTTNGATWRLKYMPVTNRIFWWVDPGQVTFFIKGKYNIKQVLVNYVPAINNMKKIPDGIVDFVMTNAVTKMNELMKGKLIKKGLDQNQNKLPQTEIDKREIA